MTDTMIKGSGNSRSIRSVPNLKSMVSSLDDLLDLLISPEGLPIDLGPINPLGCQTVGSDLSKNNLLKDATAALYGKPATAVPDEILAAIRPLITAAQNTANSKVKLAFGSYIGDGNVAGSEKTILCAFTPNVVIVSRDGYLDFGTNGSRCGGIALKGKPFAGDSSKKAIEIVSNGFVVRTSGIYAQTNLNGDEYYYIAFG